VRATLRARQAAREPADGGTEKGVG
jgi:hypothetical protein